MTTEEYNKLSLLYQVLTKRFDLVQEYSYDRWFKCYNPNFYGVKGQYLETLKRFQQLTLRHIYKGNYIQSQNFSDEYLDDLVIRVEEHQICVHSELGLVILHILFYKLQTGIYQFITLLDIILEKSPALIKTDKEKRVYKLKLYTYDEYIQQFQNIQDYSFIFHLFGRTNSSYMTIDWNNEIEIDVFRIKQALMRLSNFNFENLEEILAE